MASVKKVDLQLSGSSHDLRVAFGALQTRSDLAKLLDLRVDQLDHYAYGRGRRYSSFLVKKRRGGTRTILEPQAGLKALQKKLSQVFQAVYRPRPCVHGFVCGKSIATNASSHVRSDWILNVDLCDFFPSINFGRVRGLLMAKPYGVPTSLATILAQICTFQDELPQGAPSSPAVSNMIAARMDSELSRLAKRYRCEYTRFADDLTFSKNGKRFPEALGSWGADLSGERISIVGHNLRQVIESNGFEVNEDKVRLQKYDERQVVTGLVVNEVVNVTSRYRRRIRAMLHAWSVHGHARAEAEHFRTYDDKDRARDLPAFREIVKGHIDFLGMVRGFDHPWYLSLIAEYARLDPSYSIRPEENRRPNHLQTWRDAIWVVETDERQGTGFELEQCGFVTCAHVLMGCSADSLVVYHPRNERQKYPARPKKIDRRRDLAVLDVAIPRSPTLEPSVGFEPGVGIAVRAAGYPKYAPGSSLWEESGSITRVQSKFHDSARFLVNLAIVEGASGAPVFDMAGRVIGVASRGAKSFSGSADEAFGQVDESDYGVIPIGIVLSVCGEEVARTMRQEKTRR